MTSFRSFPLKLVRSSVVSAVVAGIALLSFAVSGAPAPSRHLRQAHDSWTSQQTVRAAELVKEISQKGSHPIVVCVGFRALFEGAHVPGASFHGPAISAEGMADLKKWAQPLPRSANIVIYCGCCPLEHCPNLHPAFAALSSMGFTHLQVLLLPQDFARDWVERGYPIAKGK